MPTELMHGQPITSVNFMVETHVGVRDVCNVSFSERDESIYVRPIAPTGRFRCGDHVFPPGKETAEVSMVGCVESTATPMKFSVHASGQVHIKLDAPTSPIVAGPAQGPPLRKMGDDHFLSVAFDDFLALATPHRTFTTTGPTIDLAFPFEQEPSGRIALYAASAPKFTVAPYYLRLNPTRGHEVYVGIAHFPNDPLGTDPGEGFTVMSGWDPTATVADAASLVWMRCT